MMKKTAEELLKFADKVAVVTGAGGGLGKEYALLLASRGASVVVNDLGGNRAGQGSSSKAADLVVDEIKNNGGKAVPNYNSVEEGDAIVKTAIDAFGRIDILINNAGILRDKSFLKMENEDWDLIQKVHLRGSFMVTKAAWPYFREQKFGRIIMTSSNAGLFGNFGQSNYSAAKLGLVGLSNTLAIEGAKYNIFCNTIVPVAGSRLTEDILPPDLFQQLNPRYVAPVVVWLCHPSCTDNGGIYEAAGGWVGKYTWKRSIGKAFIPPQNLTPESVRNNWSQITNLDSGTYPASIPEQVAQLVEDISADSETEVQEKGTSFSYNSDNAILYALGVGVSLKDENETKFLNECDADFSVLPTYGVIPSLNAIFEQNVLTKAAKEKGLPFDLTKVLHGEQYLEIRGPIPTDGALTSKAKVLDVLDKGSGALIIVEVESCDSSGNVLFYNQSSIFVVGSGKFGGQKKSSDPKIKNIIPCPSRNPDKVVTEQTSIDQAALYRLSGDKNPLHIDAAFAAVAGFKKPILHGLCTFGFAGRHIIKAYANNDSSKMLNIKGRFSSTIFPGDTIKTEMWKEGNTIHYRCSSIDTGKVLIDGGYSDLKF